MYFLTVSEMFGTSGKKVAQGVAKALNYTFYGEEELLKAAGEMGFLKDIQRLDEKGPAFFERFFSEKPKVYLDRLQSVIFEVAKKGDAVFFGKGSQLLLNSFDCALHILITGSLEKRIKRAMEENRVSREVAEKMIHTHDHDRRGFVRFAFDQDWLNPDLYDLILNTDKLSVDSAVRMIMDAAKSDEIKACGIDSVKDLGKLSLQRKVEAAFLEAGIVSPYLFITVEEDDTVRCFGLANSENEKAKIEETAKKIQGVRKVINDLTVLRGAVGGV